MQTHNFRKQPISFVLCLSALVVSLGCGPSNGISPANETVLLNSLEIVVNTAAAAIESIALQKPGPDAAKASLYAQQLTSAIDASITEFQTTDSTQIKIATALGDFGKVIVPDLPAGPAQIIVSTLIPTVETLLKQLAALQTSVSNAPAKSAPQVMSATGSTRLQAMLSKTKAMAVRAQAVQPTTN